MSGLIPQHFIDDLIARADIVEVVGKRVQLKKAGREFKACCPFHDEKTPSFTVSPSKGFYHCFGCGAHGTALGFLMEFEHLNFVEAVESLAHSMGMEVPRDEGQRPARRYDELFELMGRLEHYYQAQLKASDPAVEYLKARGIDGATAKRFGIGYAPQGWDNVTRQFGTSREALERLLAVGQVIRKDSGSHYDRFRDRIMFPIRDARGRCIGFGGRIMGDEQPKYLNTSDTVLFHKRQELYGLYEARQALRDIEQLVVVEGYMDVVGLARHGVDFAVATLGTATTDEHLNRVFRLCDNVSFCFDGDRAGRAAAWKALQTALPHIREGRQVRFVFLPDGQDPDSYVQRHGAAAFVAALDGGTPLSDFLIDELASQVDLQSVDGRARLAELAKPLVSQLPAGVYRELLIERLATTVGLSSAKLEALLSRGAKPPRGTAQAPGKSRLAPRPPTAGRPSVVRRAITLLMHFPGAAANLDVDQLDGVNKPGVDLLRELIEMLKKEPTMTTAGLLERWRQREEGRHLGKLATVELPEGEGFDPGVELSDCLRRLALAGARERIEFLIEKQKLNQLTEAERAELRRLGRNSASNG
ncbi:MAG: DNA primase [Gammaproteobacteria bacterium]|nr:DNA primase [Gammaproteobacteria bacterium]